MASKPLLPPAPGSPQRQSTTLKSALPPLFVSPTLPQMTREFEFTPADFDRIRSLIYRHAGISLSDAKQDMVYSRLARRVRATGVKTFAAYLAHLESGDPAEWEAFVNSLTTNLTSFFREPHHFPALAEYLKKKQGGRPLRIWCCASSTGEEPYSIAITVLESFIGVNPPVSILATDIDTNVLATAKAGVYSDDRVERLPADRVRSFFIKESDGFFSVRPELKKLITFQRLNLLDPHWPVQGLFDVVFCRNVMIYFDKPTQYRILSRFRPLLQPDGLLIAGHSESFLHAADLFRPIGKTIYQPTHAHN
jgi:chemotaxis protein methyltransferase CheR